VIDLGCGPAGVLALLAERVGRSGRVVGVDNDPNHVELAREFARKRRLTQVEIVEADARRTGLPSASFDLVHARTLLINLHDPVAAVAEMARLVRPGGHVLLQEPEAKVRICYPPLPAYARMGDLLEAATVSSGIDPLVGPRLPTLLREAGLDDIGVEARADIYPPGYARRAILPDLVRAMRPTLLQRGLATDEELEDLDRDVRAHFDNPDVLVMPSLFFLAWGRKPPNDAKS
jgi:SAM-dependent methyltransferase